MAIVNVTDDSFFEGSRAGDPAAVVSKVEQALEQGALFIDLGACSSRPGAEYVSAQEEKQRLTMALEAIGNRFGTGINLSIDTFRSETVEHVCRVWGEGFVVNDIHAAMYDTAMLESVANHRLPYIAMHSRGDSVTMNTLTDYEDVVDDVMAFFVKKREALLALGIRDMIFDLGFGFAKTTEQNYELVRRFDEFSVLGVPLLAGISRKTMIWKPLSISAAEALNGTTVLHVALLQKGARILRVHDVRPAVEAIELLRLIG